MTAPLPAARAMGCRESDFRVDDDDMSMVSSASRSGRKVKRKSERRALVDKGAPKTYGKRAAAAGKPDRFGDEVGSAPADPVGDTVVGNH